MAGKSVLIRNAEIYTPYEHIRRGFILVEEGVIKAIGKESYSGSRNGLEEIDLDGRIIGPGLIDTHIHGLYGYDTMDARQESFIEMSRILPRYGVTSFIPSTVTSPHEILLNVSKAFKTAYDAWNPSMGARLLGLHLEGPYINVEKAGAQNKEFIRKPSIEEFMQYYEESGRLIREITVAPEIEGALEFIRHVSSLGVVVQIGHTNATYEEALNGVLAGARKATHLFNGMRGIHHREPGVVVALMSSKSVFLELITDFIHVRPEMIRFVIDYAGVDRITMITDAISATGLQDGEYELGGLKIIVRNGVSRLANTGGLAGSTLTMDRGFRNVVSLGYSVGEAFAMASTNPARAVHADKDPGIGMLKPGFKADMVVLNDRLEVVATIIKGHIVYSR